MRKHQGVAIILSGLSFLSFAVPVHAVPSITAESQVCTSLGCGNGSPGSGGITGSGVGSALAFPVRIDSNGFEFGASAAAVQDFGIFRGYANVHAIDRSPSPFGGSYGALASGEFQDNWTITGGTGQGKLFLSFTVTGSASATAIVGGGSGSAGPAESILYTNVSLNHVFVGGFTNIQHGGTYAVTQGGVPAGLDFTFGVPFDVNVLTVVSVGGGYNRDEPPVFYQLDASAAFSDTATLTGITATDLSGNPIANITLTAESGTHYPLTITPVPEPHTYGMLVAGLLTVGFMVRRKRGSAP